MTKPQTEAETTPINETYAFEEGRGRVYSRTGDMEIGLEKKMIVCPFCGAKIEVIID